MSKIKTCFTSRWPQGWLVECDFSQLEIIVLAHLSQDPQLIRDIEDGIDLHKVRAAELFRIPQGMVSDKQRRLAKALSFQLQYGAGPVSMAKKLNISQTLTEAFVENYYLRYPMVKEWQDKLIETVRASRERSDRRTSSGLPSGRGELLSETGRRFVFYEEDNPYYAGKPWQSETNFSPTKIKNYPVQGLATGDIVPMVLGELFDELYPYNEVIQLVNTVHDSVLMDCYDSVEAANASRIATTVMEDGAKLLKERFGIEFALPLKAEAKIGKNWGEMEKLDIY